MKVNIILAQYIVNWHTEVHHKLVGTTAFEPYDNPYSIVMVHIVQDGRVKRKFM